jgi:hypothetical protein
MFGSNLGSHIGYLDLGFHSLPQSLLTNARIVSRLGHDRSFHIFPVYQSFCHSTLCSTSVSHTQTALLTVLMHLVYRLMQSVIFISSYFLCSIILILGTELRSILLKNRTKYHLRAVEQQWECFVFWKQFWIPNISQNENVEHFLATVKTLKGNDRTQLPQVISAPHKFFPNYHTSLSPYCSSVNSALLHNRRFNQIPFPTCYFTLEILSSYWHFLDFYRPFLYVPWTPPLTVQVVWCWHCWCPPPKLLEAFGRNRTVPCSYQTPHITSHGHMYN